MICQGCGNSGAIVTRTWFSGSKLLEVCNATNCGNLTAPWTPDVYFRKPEFIENLGDSSHPFGQKVESKRHKALILRKQGLREDGDRVHGSVDKGASRKPFKLKPAFESKLKIAIRKNIGILKRRP